MTAAIGSPAPAGRGLLEDYLGHLHASGLSGRAVRDRVRIATDFLGRHPDLQAWMTLPVTDRASELRRTGAWPLVCYAAAAGHVRLDAELIGAKNLAGLARAVEARDPAAFADARTRDCAWAGRRRGWIPCWMSAWPCCLPGTAARSPTSPARTWTPSTPSWLPA